VLSSAKRRMAMLERSIPIPMTAERFMARVEEFSRLTGASSDDAFQSIAASLSASDLHRLADEFTEIACGDDMEARAEVMRLARTMAFGTDGSPEGGAGATE